MEHFMAKIICPICKRHDMVAAIHPKGDDKSVIYCKVCGNFEISGTAKVMLEARDANPYLSFALRKRFNSGTINRINSQNINDIINSVSFPESIQSKANEIVNFLYLNQKYASTGFAISDNNIYQFGIKDMNEYQLVSNYAEGKKLLSIGPKFASGGGLFFLQHNGIELAEKIAKLNVNESQAFVAMWFDKSMDEVFTQGIEPALKGAGYKVVRIDKMEFLGDINEEVQNEIRKSRVVITDYTGNRGGVYYEAGFAKALNIPVICCCKESYLRELHFDVKHLNQIVWSSPEDIKDKLIKRLFGCGLNVTTD
jgi:hypothetical protein